MYVLFLAGNVSALANFFPDQERKIPRNPEIQEVFPARKRSISAFLDFRMGFGITHQYLYCIFASLLFQCSLEPVREPDVRNRDHVCE
jgi:hypothetical protein